MNCRLKERTRNYIKTNGITRMIFNKRVYIDINTLHTFLDGNGNTDGNVVDKIERYSRESKNPEVVYVKKVLPRGLGND